MACVHKKSMQHVVHQPRDRLRHSTVRTEARWNAQESGQEAPGVRCSWCRRKMHAHGGMHMVEEDACMHAEN